MREGDFMKHHNSWKYYLLILILVFGIAACKNEDPKDTSAPADTTAATTAEDTKAAPDPSAAPEVTSADATVEPTQEKTKEPTTEEDTTPADPRPLVVEEPTFSVKSGFYNEAFQVELSGTPGADIHYTLDGSEPSERSELYKGPINVAASTDHNPKATIIRARCFGANENVSDITTEVYFVGPGMDKRFTDIVISIVGDPAGLTGSARGIFTDKNAENRGRDWERAVSIKMWDANGNQIIDQDGGVRVYGAYSRRYKIKSMKIFSRKSYDVEHPDFVTDIFQTPKADGSGVMSVYDKLVIRNGGNDFQFAFLRDELNQLLCKEAGFSDYEMVLPAVCYLNGKYYGYFWLHESYCDDYFKEKYGKKEGGRGEFIVVEGSDQSKKEDDDDAEKNAAAATYNEMYNTYAKADLTDDVKYNELRKLIDVENYLDYFAVNVIVSNKDWPNNNYKAYRYFAASGEEYGEGVYDGRWRYLPHDMDYSYSLYGQREVQPDYDMLKHMLANNDERSAPLFASLMKREDCKKYFKDKVKSLLDTAFSEETINKFLNQIMAERTNEMKYYYEHLDTMKTDNWFEQERIWCSPVNLEENVAQIRDFAARRPKLLMDILEKRLP